MSIDLTRFAESLDKPGSGLGKEGALNAISGPRLGDQADLAEVDGTATEETKVDATSSAENDDVVSDEEKVPKSRFRKTREELIELRHQNELQEEKFRRLEAELENVRSSNSRVSTSEGDMPQWWKDRWGDDEASKASWDTYQHTMKDELKMLREDIRREDQQERAQRQAVETAVSETFDTQLEELEETLGKSLSDKQAAELLTIVEEYSPTDENGNFDSFISLDKAYEIYDLRQRGNRGGSKDHLSRIASTSTQGETASTPSNNPPQWGDWRRRVN